MGRKLCVYLNFLEPKHLDAIRSAAAETGFVPGFFTKREAEAARAWLRESEILYTASLTLSREAPPSLRWLAFAYAGVDPLCRDETFFAGRDCLLTSSNTYDVTLAEHTVMVLLMLLRRMPEYQAITRRRQWQAGLPIRSIRDGQFTILGAGRIGSRIAENLKGLGAACVTGISRSGCSQSPFFDRVLPTADLDRILPETEHLICVLPSTPETRGLFTRERFALLPRGATFLNVGRGDLLDQAALIEALASGQLSGAAIDVTDPEPLPPEHPLWDCPNLILTPHAAGGLTLPRSRDDNVALFCANLRRYAAGAPLQGLVDRKAGY